MTIKDWTDAHPDVPFRVIMYTPAPDAIDDDGKPFCCEEGTSSTVFDATVSGDMPFDLLPKEITTINEGADGIPELEFIPDAFWTLW